MSDTNTATCGRSRHNGPCVQPAGHLDDHRDANGRTDFNYGPLQYYEIVWMSGHVETIPAHQVTYPHAGMAVAGMTFGIAAEAGPPRIRIHAEIDGHWLVTLSALEEDIRSMRLVTTGERIPGGAA